MATAPSNTKAQGLAAKLKSMQKHIKTFAITDDSGKKSSNGKSEYKYTPGWQIVEAIRELMDQFDVMLRPQFSLINSQVIEYPVYKMINGTPTAFNKMEMHVLINAEFTWVDVNTGETDGPYRIVSQGANGMDKSVSSAISLAERYFLLKFFQITTRDIKDEPDAQDGDALPGIPAGSQPDNASAPQIAKAQQAAPMHAPARQPAPAQGHNPYATPPTYKAPVQPANAAPFNPSDPNITAAVNSIMMFDAGTPSHQQALNQSIQGLTSLGYQCFAPRFIDNLVEMGQAAREGRTPNLTL